MPWCICSGTGTANSVWIVSIECSVTKIYFRDHKKQGMFKAIPLYAKNLESGESHEICGGGILSGGKYYYEYYKEKRRTTRRDGCDQKRNTPPSPCCSRLCLPSSGWCCWYGRGCRRQTATGALRTKIRNVRIPYEHTLRCRSCVSPSSLLGHAHLLGHVERDVTSIPDFEATAPTHVGPASVRLCRTRPYT